MIILLTKETALTIKKEKYGLFCSQIWVAMAQEHQIRFPQMPCCNEVVTLWIFFINNRTKSKQHTCKVYQVGGLQKIGENLDTIWQHPSPFGWLETKSLLIHYKWFIQGSQSCLVIYRGEQHTAIKGAKSGPSSFGSGLATFQIFHNHGLINQLSILVESSFWRGSFSLELPSTAC